MLAVDPGRDKAGLAVVSHDGGCVHRRIVPAGDAAGAAADLARRFGVRVIAVGDRTGASVASTIAQVCPDLTVVLVDEHRSTEEARALYLDTVPARGLARLLPRGLRVPPGPVDDFAAWALGRRYLRGSRADRESGPAPR